jgi:malonyl CoA-acyl carrier protein transacylase
MEYILNLNEEDREIINDYIEGFKQLTAIEVVKLYNQQKKCSITGVRRQALYLYALRQVFLDHLGIVPISLKDGDFLAL